MDSVALAWMACQEVHVSLSASLFQPGDKPIPYSSSTSLRNSWAVQTPEQATSQNFGSPTAHTNLPSPRRGVILPTLKLLYEPTFEMTSEEGVSRRSNPVE
jgi:hypothetical protein